MAYVSDAPRTQAAVSLGWFSSLVEAVKLRMERSRVYRETYEELATLTDRELSDIGVSRLMLRDLARETAARVQ